MSDYYRCTCGNHLEKVTQSANSMLNSEQFDAARMGDWFCRRCPKNEGKNRYFWDSEVAALASAPAQPGRVSLSANAAHEIQGMLEEAAALIGSMPETIFEQLQVRHFLQDELRGGAGIVRDAMASAPAQPVAEPAAEVLSSRPGNDTSTIDKAFPDGTKLYTHPSPPEGMAGWISVKDRLPPPFEEVWVHPRPSDYCCEACVDTAGNWKYSEYETNFGVNHIKCEVEYWMPAPPIPASEAKEASHA